MLFVFLLNYLLVINSRIGNENNVLHILRPDAPIANFLGVFIIIIFIQLTINLIQNKENKKRQTVGNYVAYFGISFVLYLVVYNLIGLGIAIVFDTVSRNFNFQTLLNNNLSSSINFALFGSLYLAFIFFKQNNTYRTELDHYNQALASSVIQQLKAQLNPHFLFNNLNTLDELIEEDPSKASAFLQ